MESSIAESYGNAHSHADDNLHWNVMMAMRGRAWKHNNIQHTEYKNDREKASSIHDHHNTRIHSDNAERSCIVMIERITPLNHTKQNSDKRGNCKIAGTPKSMVTVKTATISHKDHTTRLLRRN